MTAQEEPADLDQQEKDRGIVSKLWAMLGIIASALLFVCIFFEKPEWIAVFVRGNLGYSSYFLPSFLLYQSVLYLQKRPKYRDRLFASTCFYISLIIFISASYTPIKDDSWYLSGISLNGGGYLGELLALLMSLGLGDGFAKIVALFIAIIGFFSISNPAWFQTAIDRAYHSREGDGQKNRNILSRLSDYNHYARNSARLLENTEETTDTIEIYEESNSSFSPSSRTESFSSNFAALSDRMSSPFSKRRDSSFSSAASSSSASSFSRDSSASKHTNQAPDYAPMILGMPLIGEQRRSVSESSISKTHSNDRPVSKPASPDHSTDGKKSESRNSVRDREDDLFDKKIADHFNVSRDDQKKHNETVSDKKINRSEEPQNSRKKASKQYSVPPTQLLDMSTKPKADNSKFISEVVEKLQNVFQNFGVDAKVLSYEEGPTITMFEVVLGLGVKISKLQNLSEDIALNLAAPTVRIAPIEGKSTVGIEVPNSETTAVSMREIIDDKEFIARRSPLNVVLGKDISGKPVVADLASMPHLLVAGATGSGKSVCVNAMILSILLNATPEEVRFVMIDPKQVELSNYNDLPHLIMPVVTEAKQAAAALNWTVQEMERRYSLMLEKKVKDYKSFNQKCSVSERLPYIVVIVDELADLMMVAAKQVEEAICRIAQKARAAGIHLVLATQRPSVDVITGLIKANIPSRIAFSVSSQVDSRTILDSAGAEKLLGKGDMLYHPVSLARAKRVQGAFVSTSEIDQVVAFILKQGYKTEQITLDKISSLDTSTNSGGEDEYLDEAIQLVRETRKASASMLQRKFSIGYNRAARLIDIMEEMGVIGPQQGSKSREVF